jgi:hypothetical protein
MTYVKLEVEWVKSNRGLPRAAYHRRVMILARIQFTVRRLTGVVAIAAILTACGAEYARRARVQLDLYDDHEVDEPLVNPTAFFGLERNRVDLGRGRFLEVESTTRWYTNDPPAVWKPADSACLEAGLVAGQLASSKAPGVIDLERILDGRALLYVSHRPWYCGTYKPLITLIRIPLIPRAVYGNQRLPIGVGRVREQVRSKVAGTEPMRIDS